MADDTILPPPPVDATGVPGAQYSDSIFGKYGFHMMMASAAISGIGDILSAQNQANALQTQSKFNQFQSQVTLQRANVAEQANEQAEGAELQQSGSHANAIIGAQRAAYGSQGVNVNAGVPLAEQVSQGKMSAVDAMTIRNNAALKAYGINAGAIQEAGQQEFEALGESTQAQQTLALGGAKAANAITNQLDQYLYTKAYLAGRV